MKAQDNRSRTDLKNVIPYVKRKVLQGASLVSLEPICVAMKISEVICSAKRQIATLSSRDSGGGKVVRATVLKSRV